MQKDVWVYQKYSYTVYMLRYIALTIGSVGLFVSTLFYVGIHYPSTVTLSPDEQTLIQSIYGDSVDTEKIHIAYDTIYTAGSTVTLGNTIHVQDKSLYVRGFTENTLTEDTLIHEAGHIYQYQHFGLSYVPKSLLAQLLAWIDTGSRGGAYNWQARVAEGKKWHELNPEEQAQLITDYFEMQNGAQVTGISMHTLECFSPILSRHCIQ